MSYHPVPASERAESLSDSATLAPTIASSTTTLVPHRGAGKSHEPALHTIKEKDDVELETDAGGHSAPEAHGRDAGLRELLAQAALTLASCVVLLEPLGAALAWPSILAERFSSENSRYGRGADERVMAFTSLGWYGLYYVAMATFAPMVASSLHYSARWTILAGLIFLAAGNAIIGSAGTRGVVFLGRFFAGVGATPIPMSAFIWRSYRESLPSTARRYNLAFVAGLVILATAVCAPLLAGALCDFVTWRWVFYVQAIVAGLAAVLCLALPNPKIGSDTGKDFGLIVAMLIVGTQVCVILTFSDWEADFAAAMSCTLVLPLVCPWLLWWAAWWGNRDSYHAQKRRPVILASMLVVGLSGAVIGLGYTAAIRLQVDDSSPWAVGLRLLALSAPMAVASITSLSLCAATRCHTVLLAVATSLLTVAGAGLVATVNVDILAVQLVLLALGGVGAGLASNVPLDLVRGELRHEPDVFRHVPGIMTFWSNAGRVIAIAAVGMGPMDTFIINHTYLKPYNVPVVTMFPGIPLTQRAKLSQSLGRTYAVALAFGAWALLFALWMWYDRYQVMDDMEWRAHKEAARAAKAAREARREKSAPRQADNEKDVEEASSTAKLWPGSTKSAKTSRRASLDSTRPPSYTSEATPLYKGHVVN